MTDRIPTLEELDADGALQETAAKAGLSRSQFLRRSAFAGGGLIVGGLPVAFSLAQGASKSDVDILNYALTLEYLEAAFYAEANKGGALSGQYARFSKVAGAHEQAHVDALKKALGGKAVKKPSFDFKGTTDDQTTFAQTAMLLEDTGVKAYQGAAPDIKSRDVFAAAISIHPVEARHAAWIASIIGKGSSNPSPAPEAFNPAADMATILAAVQSTGFITNMASASPGGAVGGTPSMTG
jgi:hypothetical protein